MGERNPREVLEGRKIGENLVCSNSLSHRDEWVFPSPSIVLPNKKEAR